MEKESPTHDPVIWTPSFSAPIRTSLGAGPIGGMKREVEALAPKKIFMV
jgi:hypothetical protein